MRVEANTPASLTFAHDIPASLVWEGATWRVIDLPTPLTREVEWLHPIITHPPEGTVRFSGWRFTAKSASGGEAQTFDVFESW